VRLLLHAITTVSDARAAATVGLRGEPLVTVEVHGLLAWVTRLSERQSFTRQDVLDHHRVVSKVFDCVEACLPARFPTVIGAERELWSETRAAELAAQLEAVRGACEVAVTAVWTSAEPPATEAATTPGRQYLLKRASSQRLRDRASELADMLEEQADADLLEARRQVCPSADVALSLALLLKRASAKDIQGRLGRGVGTDVRILVNGPWAPYTFADARPIASREK
jgi:Gas vesicle synthesis protein GvpL/GvpF